MTSVKYPVITDSNDKRLRWVERISWLMDNQFRLPGTSFRFGLDPVINFVPIFGDLTGFLISAALVLVMTRHGASGKVVILMTLNIFLDALIGAVPVIGWLFDFAYKANDRNIRLLKRHYQEGKYQGSGKGIIAVLLVVILGFIVGFVYLIWVMIEWLGNVTG